MRHAADTNGDGIVSDEEKAAWLAANPGKTYAQGWINDGKGNGFKTPWGTVRPSDPTRDPTADAQRAALNDQGKASSDFAGLGEKGYGALGQEAQQSRDYLRRVATGAEPSLAGEQLRQGLQQNYAAQRSMAASAAPQNQAMAARTAAIQMGRQGTGMSGAAALAGMQERQAAQQALADMIMKQRQQDMQVALGSRQNAISGYGGVKPEGSAVQRFGPAIAAAFGLGAK